MKPALLKMFEYHRTLIDQQGPDTAAVLRSTMMIHIELEAERKKNTYLNLSRMNGWPILLDFQRLPDRIVAMTDELETLIMVQGARGDGPVQQGLRDSLAREGLGSDFKKFATLHPTIIPEIIINNARPG